LVARREDFLAAELTIRGSLGDAPPIAVFLSRLWYDSFEDNVFSVNKFDPWAQQNAS
jgi:hypothetical protein